MEVSPVKFTRKNRVSIAFELEWNSPLVHHREQVLIQKADLWRDVVPPDLEERIVRDINCTPELPFGKGSFDARCEET
jgi:hypothetical protein